MIDVHSLDGVDLFAKLSPDECRAVADSMSTRSLEANKPIVWIGDAAGEFFIIASGSVTICMPDDYQIALKTQFELSNVHQKLDRLLERKSSND